MMTAEAPAGAETLLLMANGATAIGGNLGGADIIYVGASVDKSSLMLLSQKGITSFEQFRGKLRFFLGRNVYDNWVNPQVAGNGTGVNAAGPPRHGLPASATVVIPANGLVVFTRGGG